MSSISRLLARVFRDLFLVGMLCLMVGLAFYPYCPEQRAILLPPPLPCQIKAWCFAVSLPLCVASMCYFLFGPEADPRELGIFADEPPAETDDTAHPSRAPATVDTPHRAGDDDRHACKICMANSIALVFTDCGHALSCHACAATLKRCPACRAPTERRRTLYYG